MPNVFFRAVFALGLLVFLLVYFDFVEVVEQLGSITPAFVLFIFLILSLQFLLSLVRWCVIVKSLDLDIRLPSAISIFGFGTLANVVLVNSIAGISVRAVLLSNHGIKFSESAAALALERIAAAGGLAIPACIGLFVALPIIAPHLPHMSLVWAMILIGAVLCFAVALASVALIFTDFMKGFVENILSVIRMKRVVLDLLVMSTLIVMLGFGAVAISAYGLDVNVGTAALLSVLPFVAVISALPISIGGWGVREGSMVAALGMLGVLPEQALAISIIYGLVGLLVSVSLGAVSVIFIHRRESTGDLISYIKNGIREGRD